MKGGLFMDSKVLNLITECIYSNKTKYTDNDGVWLVSISEQDYNNFYENLKKIMGTDDFYFTFKNANMKPNYDSEDLFGSDMDGISCGTSYLIDFSRKCDNFDEFIRDIFDLDPKFYNKNFFVKKMLENKIFYNALRKTLLKNNLIFINFTGLWEAVTNEN